MIDWTDPIKVVVTLIVGSGGTWLAQRLRTKPEKRKEEISADQAAWNMVNSQMTWINSQLVELQKTATSQAHRIQELETSKAQLEQRQDEYEDHIDDVYRVISQEPDGGRSIFSKFTSERPGRRKKITQTPVISDSHTSNGS